MVKKLPWRAKPKVPCERALKTVVVTGVESRPRILLRLTIGVTSDCGTPRPFWSTFWSPTETLDSEGLRFFLGGANS